jgi:predicted porin
MQKKLIALAIAGLTTAPAFAADNVTIYGRVDYGYDSRSGSDGARNTNGSKAEFRDGVMGGSRIGFKGAEDLGNGTKAIFETEFGLATDAPASAAGLPASAAFWTNRHSYVGLTGNWGTAVGGRLDGIRYGIFLAAEQLAGGVGNFTSMTTQYDRADNAIAYISPNWNGFTLTLAHSTNTGGGTEGAVGVKNTSDGHTAGGNKGDDVLNSIMGKYDNGPLTLWADYETTTQKDIGNSRLRTGVLAGTYDFQVVKLGLLFDTLKGDPCSNIGGATYGQAVGGLVCGAGYDRTNWLISAKMPLGKFNLKALYGHVHDKKVTDGDAGKFGLGLDYSLSKRTQLYTNYGRVSNDSKAAYGINASPNSNSYYGVNGFDLGMSHTF